MPEALVATIEKVEPIKSGTGKNGRSWTLLRVRANHEGALMDFTTFNAEWKQSVGQERTIEYEKVETQRGERTFIDCRIIDPKPQSGRFGADLKSINAKLDRILEILEARS